jgi:acetoin utilization deacetylase AcuC-like enzyme
MTTAVYWHPDIFVHDQHANHVAMSSNRIQSVFDHVRAVPGVELRLAKGAGPEVLRFAHDDDFVDHLLAVAPTRQMERHAFDTETVMNPFTLPALLLSVGAAMGAVDAVLAREATNAFCVTYAGHHARPDGPEGFCFINTAAIAAHHALRAGVERLAVVDFDTHSGNGTALSMASVKDGRVLFAETYQSGYPGRVFPDGAPAHVHRTRCRNPTDFAHAWRRHAARLKAFRPELMIASAGFDAHAADPLGQMELADSAYTWIAQELLAATPHLVAVLEGGYHPEQTPRCAALFVSELVSAARQPPARHRGKALHWVYPLLRCSQ